MTNRTHHPVTFHRGGQQEAVNVTRDGCCCTLNTRYEDMALPSDILTLAHFPKTVVLITFS